MRRAAPLPNSVRGSAVMLLSALFAMGSCSSADLEYVVFGSAAPTGCTSSAATEEGGAARHGAAGRSQDRVRPPRRSRSARSPSPRQLHDSSEARRWARIHGSAGLLEGA